METAFSSASERGVGIMLKLPWRVIPGGTAHCPRIVDRDGDPVVSFGNQMRHRGHLWAWFTARFIVEQVNRGAQEELEE